MQSKQRLDLAQLPPRIAELVQRLEGEEHVEFEMKSAAGGLPKSIWPTVSAFANTLGGWILLGLVYRDGEVVVEGVRNAPTRLQEFTDLLNNREKISFPACGPEDASVETFGEDQFIVIRVPAAPRKHRPVYINDNPYRGTFVRRHGGDYHCPSPEVDRMIRERSDGGADTHVLERYGVDDLDAAALAQYRRRYQTQHPGSPWNNYSDHQFLQAIRAFRHDRETGRTGITVAGLLLLGVPDALRDWRSHHMIDFRVIPQGLDGDTRWADRVVWEGNLLGAFDTIYPRLTQGLPVPFRLEGGRRVDETYAHVALREALVNLLVHADYAESTPSLIIQSAEGYSFRNPGSSRVPEQDLLNGDCSDPRNPELVKMFRLIGLAEEAGTGIPRIFQSWHALGYKHPLIDTGTEKYEFTLQLRHAHLLSEEDREWLQQLQGDWSEEAQIALIYAKHNGTVDNQTVCRLTGIHTADATKILRMIRDRGYFQQVGHKRAARYQLSVLALAGPTIVQKTLGPVPNSISGKGESSIGLGENPIDSVENSIGLWPELQAMAQIARQHPHLSATNRDQLIVALCSRAPLSARQIATLLDRNELYIRTILQSLIASGRLRYVHPELPTHPRQQYAAAESNADSITDPDQG